MMEDGKKEERGRERERDVCGDGKRGKKRKMERDEEREREGGEAG